MGDWGKMSLRERLSEVLAESVDTLIKVKDSFWPIKKGEALERASSPSSREEALSQTHIGPNSAILLSTLPALEDDINFLCGLDDRSLTQITGDLARAFGSKRGKRMELTFDTIKQSKEVPNMSMTQYRGTPEYFGDKRPEDFVR